MLHEIRARDLGSFSVLSLAGEFDLVSRRELETACHHLSDGATALIIDLTRVTFLDAGTVNVLDLLAVGMRTTGRPSATVAPTRLHRVLRMIGYGHLREEAIATDLPSALLILAGSHEPAEGWWRHEVAVAD